ALAVSPALSHFAPERNASIADVGAAEAIASSDLVPSKATAGAARRPAPITIPARRDLAVRIALLLGRAARMRHRTVDGRADLLGVLPQVAGGCRVVAARLPCRLALGQFLIRQPDIERAGGGVDLDDVTVLEQADRTADGGLGADMADAEAARRAGEAAVGDQRHLLAHALAVERRRGRQHLAHARAAARSLVTDDENLAFLVGALLHRLEAGFLAVEAVRRTGELQRLHAGDLHDAAFGR